MIMDLLRPVDTVFRSVEIEAAEKIRSAIQFPEPIEARFLEACRYSFPPEVYAEVTDTLAFAKSVRSTDPNHPSMRAYFSHPLRVSTFVLRLMKVSSRGAVITALIHNIFEVSGLTEDELVASGISKRVAESIRLLTIDRSQQYDSEYLKIFYRNIEAFSDDLALVKCVDRIDNLLMFELLEKTAVHHKYIDLSEQFIVPIANRLSEDFGFYMGEVIAYARESSCKRDLKQRYEEFLKRANSQETTTTMAH